MPAGNFRKRNAYRPRAAQDLARKPKARRKRSDLSQAHKFHGDRLWTGRERTGYQSNGGGEAGLQESVGQCTWCAESSAAVLRAELTLTLPTKQRLLRSDRL